MRYSFCFATLAPLVCTIISARTGLAQDSTADSEVNVAEVSSEFRELIIQNALQSSPITQELAASIVVARDYKDARFDDFIREALSETDLLSDERTDRQDVAIRLMPHSTLDDAEQVRLLLDRLVLDNEAYAAWCIKHPNDRINNFRGQRPNLYRLIVQLENLTEAMAAQLEQRLAVDNPPAILCAIAESTGSRGEALLPLLLKAAKEGDDAVIISAVKSANEILTRVQQRQEDAAKIARRTGSATNSPPLDSDIDRRLIAYAERIIDRYDMDKDGALTEEEWSKMLFNPAAYDSDKDGRITIEEYAQMMESRNALKNRQ